MHKFLPVKLCYHNSILLTLDKFTIRLNYIIINTLHPVVYDEVSSAVWHFHWMPKVSFSNNKPEQLWLNSESVRGLGKLAARWKVMQ